MQEGDVCRMRLSIGPLKERPYFLRDPYMSLPEKKKWSQLIEKLCKERVELQFNAQLYQDRYYRVRDGRNSFMSDIFRVYETVVQYGYDRTYGYDMLLPEEFVGNLPDGTKLECDFFPEAQRACIAWIMCAQLLRVHKDMIQVIGKMILASWNDKEVWYETYKKNA